MGDTYYPLPANSAAAANSAELDRRKAARQRERERSRERYQEKRAAREARGMSLPRGRQTASAVEPLRGVMVGVSVHAALARLAAAKSYANGCDRKVTMRELVEEALAARYPELRELSEEPSAPSEEDIFSEIVMRAMAGAQDPEANWNGAGDKVAIELPSPVAGQPNAQFKLADLAYYLFRKMENGEPTDHITTVRELVRDRVGW